MSEVQSQSSSSSSSSSSNSSNSSSSSSSNSEMAPRTQFEAQLDKATMRVAQLGNFHEEDLLGAAYAQTGATSLAHIQEDSKAE